MSPSPHARAIVVAAFTLVLGGCAQLGYYVQAAKGQYRIIADREPVSDLLASEDTPESLKSQLELADRMRRFALERMALGDNPGFSHYTDLGRRYVTWNVVAAPAYSLEPKTWCFPIAGCVAYKGYFGENDALAEADALRALDYDVITYGVRAYSTLGWFADPLLNTFINFPEPDLAALIFHELAHQVVYVQDDSAFNEAFATAVELALVTEWLELYGDPAAVPGLLDQRRRQAEITAMVLDYRDRLAAAYLGADPVTAKTELFAAMKSEYAKRALRGEGTPFYDWWFQRPLNNADLLSVATYYHLVPAFSALLESRDGDLPAFFNAVRELGEKPAEERNRLLVELAPG